MFDPHETEIRVAEREREETIRSRGSGSDRSGADQEPRERIRSERGGSGPRERIRVAKQRGARGRERQRAVPGYG